MKDEIISRTNTVNTDEFPHALVCYDNNGELIHLCLYEAEPTAEDLIDLTEELKTDEEFNMTEMFIDKDYRVYSATGKELDDLLESLGFIEQ